MSVEADNLQSTTLEQRQELAAIDKAAHWQKFVKGEEDQFSAYFMLDYDGHEIMRKRLLAHIEASPDLPHDKFNPLTVARAGNVALLAMSNIDDSGHPFDVYYTGLRIED